MKRVVRSCILKLLYDFDYVIVNRPVGKNLKFRMNPFVFVHCFMFEISYLALCWLLMKTYSQIITNFKHG